MIVFNNGVLYGSNLSIIEGGHLLPISILGDNDMWKKTQNIDKKKKISLIINKIIPHFNILLMWELWLPWNVLSRIISRHHWKIDINNPNIPIVNKLYEDSWKIWIPPINIIINLKDVNKGQGLLVTIWNGWLWVFFFKIDFNIICFLCV